MSYPLSSRPPSLFIVSNAHKPFPKLILSSLSVKKQPVRPLISNSGELVVMATTSLALLTAWFAISGLLISETREIVQTHFLSSSPLEGHPVSIWIFITGLPVYCLAYGYHIKCYVYTPMATSSLNRSLKLTFISGSLAYTALISMLVSRSLQPLLYTARLMVLLIYFKWEKIAEILSGNIGLYFYEQWRRAVRGNVAAIRRPQV